MVRRVRKAPWEEYVLLQKKPKMDILKAVYSEAREQSYYKYIKSFNVRADSNVLKGSTIRLSELSATAGRMLIPKRVRVLLCNL